MNEDELVTKITNVRAALLSNRNFQELLKIALKRVEIAQSRNVTLRDMFAQRNARSRSKRATKSEANKAPGTPYFQDERNLATPPYNPDTQRKKARMQASGLPETFVFRKWSKKENKALVSGIIQQNQQILVQRLYDKYQSGSADKMTLEMFNQEVESIRSKAEGELSRDVSGINWQTLADTCVTGRTADACKVHWMNQCEPTINQEKWSKEEDLKLLDIVQEEEGRDWEKIAEKLGTNRRPFQCLVRYQRSLNKDILRSEWSEEETSMLLKAVATYGKKNWQQIGNCLNGRTGQQCLHRWRDASNPMIKRGNWTTDEDRRLTMSVKAYSSKWVKIQRHIPGRTDVQCRERWMNVLNPELTCSEWTLEEDTKLQLAVSKIGVGKWASVAKELYPRTDNQCWRRWKTKNARAVIEYTKKRKQKKYLVRNFAGRAKERSALTVEDLGIDEEEEQRRKRRRLSGPNLDVPLLETSMIAVDISDLEVEPSDPYQEPFCALTELPLVLPNSITFKVLGNILIDIDGDKKQTNLLFDEKVLKSNEFKTFAAWFSGLFLFPTLIIQHLGFLGNTEGVISSPEDEPDLLDLTNNHPSDSNLDNGEELDLF